MLAGDRARAWAARWGFWAGLGCAVLAPLAVHWAAGRTLVWFDSARLYAPQRWIVDDALRGFRLPLWNPYLGGGLPFLADAIHGALHPVSIATAWLGTGRSGDVLVGGYVGCAGLGAALLAREMGASRSGAAVSAFAYGLSGYVLSMAGNLVFLAGAGSLPFCLVGLRRFAADPRASSLAAAAGGAAALALSGDLQAALVGGVLGVVLAWEAVGWRGAVRAVAAGAAGAAVAGVQLLPTAVHVGRTVRASEAWDPTPLVWSFEPWRIPELVLPGLLSGSPSLMEPIFGALAGPGHWMRTGYPFPFSASVVLGVVPVALAIVGAWTGRRGMVLAGLGLVLLWIALGPAAGASALLGHVPVWRSFRYSEKLVGPLTLVLSTLAALGADAVLDRRVPGRRVLAVAAGLGAVAIAASALEISRLEPGLASVAAPRVVRGAWHVALAALGLAASLLMRRRLGRVGGGLGLAATVWLAAVAASPAALRPGLPEARLRSPMPALEAAAPGPRILTPYTYEPWSKETGLDWIDQAFRDYAWKGYAPLTVRWRLDSLDDYEAMEPRRHAALKSTFGPRWPEVARRFGLTHVLVDPPRSEEHRALHAIATSGGTRTDPGDGLAEIWTIPHRPWASFPPEVRTVAGEDAAREELARVMFKERSPAAIVEGVSPFRAGPGRVLSIARRLESVRIEAEAPGDATLVVADTWWPGWEATVDGLPATIFRADALVRAVRWPAGRHVLEMRYRPPEVRAGLAVSALGIAALVAGMFALRRREPAAVRG
jgi:hypothetical protein